MSYYPFPSPSTPATYIRNSIKAVVTGPVTFLSFYLVNDSTSARFFWVKNSASTFSTNDASSTSLYVFPLQARSIINLGNNFWGNSGTLFSSGISWGISTSATTFTPATTTEHVLMIQKS